MIKEDTNGFINFPLNDYLFKPKNGYTLVYLVAFEGNGLQDNLSNLNLKLPGIFISDDVISRPDMKTLNLPLDELVENQMKQVDYDSMYFPNLGSDNEYKRDVSINFITSICIGWCNNVFEHYNGKITKFWSVTFKDLSNDGKNMYYGMKKLHNTKEVRLLTFNTNI
jgi:hypothetical protein